MKSLLVGGTFSDNATKAKASKLFGQFAGTFLSNLNCSGRLINGGSLKELEDALEYAKDVQVCVWWANIPDKDLPKVVKQLKRNNPTMVLVTSKRNTERQYSIADVTMHALKCRANLLAEIRTRGKQYCVRVLDPLGNQYHEDTVDFAKAGNIAGARCVELLKVRRACSIRVDNAVTVPNQPDFLAIVREAAHRFSELLPQVTNTERFLGNASFRCSWGFPSFRNKDGVFVTRRNVNKEELTMDQFVLVESAPNGNVLYWGNHKPSVDTPIQLSLYNYYPQVKYMLHGHVYVKNAKFVTNADDVSLVVPCGALQEAEAVKRFVDRRFVGRSIKSGNIKLNLRGHGHLILARDLDFIRETEFMGRNFPEYQHDVRIEQLMARDEIEGNQNRAVNN